ncbi:hypothetical protein ASPWEDRAFT_175188 [Aspergillus wentii DTO 134E9]|uniref:ribonuclease T2 n=1 Tax=Aspergillus wentii DTO 134E9 TaxID=1073089 RepID=A0A1L9RAC0_ASPWE|nr:uncharacterized protein ASPWEDRAFT_175188 [Aspergillus wentii DTO 134E9]KAI9934459.1 hypothetical protein MW887_000073 [Aspergillus wentii]OJJ31874.1 hypothetical protein ASPWEDRAFT_175188 [Aspergillus wentii DTO 134E9]
MHSLSLCAALAAALSNIASASLYGESYLNHSCVLHDPIPSCSKNATLANVDTCCTETFGGLVMSTQFWDTYTGLESEGQVLPKNSWTLHGLWPDFCNGSYTQYCDLSRQYDPSPSPSTLDNGAAIPPWKGPSIDSLIEPFGRKDLLAYMNKYWVGQAQKSNILWAHEFSKHATCYSTFDIPCYGPQSPAHYDILDFFTTALLYFRHHPTYQWLAETGITPSNTTSYTLSNLQSALKRGAGARPYIGCSGPRYNETDAGRGSMDDGYTVLDQIYYYMHVLGRPQDGMGVPVDASVEGSLSSCAKSEGGVWYYERASGSEV